MTDIPAIAGSDTGTWKSLLNTVISLVNGKFNSRPYIWANAAARTAQTGMTIGEYGYQTDTQVTYRATSATATQPWSSPWISFTSTFTNITVGTGGSQALVYRYEFGSVRVRGPITLGSSGFAVGTGPTMTLPVTAATPAHSYQIFFGATSLYDISGISNYISRITTSNTSTTIVIIWATSSTTGGVTNLTATVPFTWAAGDVFDIDFTYTPA